MRHYVNDIIKKFNKYFNSPNPTADIEIIKKYHLLDGARYLWRNPDVAQADMDPVEHFVLFGHNEGRAPYHDDDIPTYLVNQYGISLTEQTQRKINKIIRRYGLFDAKYYVQQHPEVISKIEDIRFFQKHHLFDGERYLLSHPDVAQARQDPLVHYVFHGFQEERAPYPADRVRLVTFYLNHPDLGQKDEISGDLKDFLEKYRLWDETLEDWLEEIKIIERYRLFDHQAYLTRNPDVAQARLNPLVHYVLHGCKEGRSPFPMLYYGPSKPESFSAGKVPAPVRKVVQKYRLFDGQLYLLQNPEVAQLHLDPLEHYLRHGLQEGRRLFPDLTMSRTIQDQVQAAMQYEPAVDPFQRGLPQLVPPFFDPIYFLHREVKARLQAPAYDNILCVPWVRMGGADHYAGQVAHALRRLRPNESILLLRTLTDHFERSEWFPAGIDTVDLSDLLAQYGPEASERLLYILFAGLQPSRIININSPTCWQVFKRFGQRLAAFNHLYAFLFGWDLTEAGVRVGYPSYYPLTGGFLSAVFTDSDYIKRDLQQIYAVPPHLQARIIQLSQPVQYPAAQPTMAERAALSRPRRSRPVVLWAGRLDRQKRFDLVQEIAARLPQVDFLCWGKPLLDGPIDLSKSPPNLSLRPPYRSLDELPLAEADVWLFTSSWEGTPTILIDVAMQGMAVVASAVGGVVELIREDTGWPIAAVNEVEAYVASLQEALEDPDLRVKKALNLQQLAQSRHSQEKFDAELQRVLAQEEQRDRYYRHSQCA